MKTKVSKRIIWLFAVLVLVSIIAVFLYKVKEHFVEVETKPVTVSGCENDKVPDLKCDDGWIFSKAPELKYGRWNNKICPHPTVNPKTPNKETQFKPYPLSSAFVGKQVATFNGKTAYNLANDDPVPGILKHYEVNGTCKPVKTTVTKNGCDGGKVPNLSCPDGYLVENATMKFGRWDNTLCKKGSNVDDKAPAQFKEYPISPDYYADKKTIALNKKPMEFIPGSDPAPGTKKHYLVTANCKLP